MSKNSDIRCTICNKPFRTVMRVETRYEEYQPYKEEVYYPAEDEKLVEIRGASGYVCADCFSKGGEHIKCKMVESINSHIDMLTDELDYIDEKYRKIIEDSKKSLNTKLERLNNVKELVDTEGKLDRKKFDNLKQRRQEDIRLHWYLNDVQHIIEWEDAFYYGKKPIDKFNKEYDLKLNEYPEGFIYATMVTKEEYFNIIMNAKVENKTPMEVIQLIEKERGL